MKSVLALTIALGLAGAGRAHADDDPLAPAAEPAGPDNGKVDKPAEPAPRAGAPKQRPGLSGHRLYVRAGVANVAPHVSSREMELANIDGPASLSLMNGPIAGSGADISSDTIPAAIIGYELPFARDRFSIETILGKPLNVKFTATGTLANQSIAPTALGIPTGVPALGPEVGTATGVPPVLTLTYAFTDRRSMLVPYLGAGGSVLFATNAKITNPILTEVSQPEMKVSPAAGFVIQGGLDVKIWKKVRARLDIKYIAGMLAKAEVDHMIVKTPGIPLFDTVEVGTAKLSAWVNPTIVQLAIGYDF